MKKKIFIFLCILAAVLVWAGLVTSYIDSARVRNAVEPKCTLKIVSDDGSRITYWGLGYKVVRYTSASADEPYENNIGVRYGSWFMKYPAPEKINKLFDINKEHYYKSGNLKFSFEKERLAADEKVIRYCITNIGEKENAIAGDSECFELQKLVDGEWKAVGTKIDHYWTEPALILPPDAVEEREIDLEKYFFLPLDKGEYRISVEYLVSHSFEVY